MACYNIYIERGEKMIDKVTTIANLLTAIISLTTTIIAYKLAKNSKGE